mgnify:FL=1
MQNVHTHVWNPATHFDPATVREVYDAYGVL